MFLLALLGAGTCLARDGRVEARIRIQSHHQAGQAIAAGAGVADRDDASVRQRFGRRTQLDVGTATVQHQPLLDFQVAPRGRRVIDAGDRTLFGCEPDPSDSTPGPILVAGVPRVGVNRLPDTSFGGDGLVELPGFTSPRSTLYAPPRIALQADGKIVAAATLDVADQPGNAFDWYVTRLNADGSTDFGFGYQSGYSRLRVGDPYVTASSESYGELVSNLVARCARPPGGIRERRGAAARRTRARDRIASRQAGGRADRRQHAASVDAGWRRRASSRERCSVCGRVRG